MTFFLNGIMNKKKCFVAKQGLACLYQTDKIWTFAKKKKKFLGKVFSHLNYLSVICFSLFHSIFSFHFAMKLGLIEHKPIMNNLFPLFHSQITLYFVYKSSQVLTDVYYINKLGPYSQNFLPQILKIFVTFR